MHITIGFNPTFDVGLDRCDFCGSANNVILDDRTQRNFCPTCRDNLAIMSGPVWDALSDAEKARIFSLVFES